MEIIFRIVAFLIVLDVKIFILKCRLRSLYLKLNGNISDLFKAKNAVPVYIHSTDVNNALIETRCPGYTKEYLTFIIHPAFGEGCCTVVEEYENETDAKAGHEKWVVTFEKGLPSELKDLVTDEVYKREFVDYSEDYFEVDFE